MKSKRKYPTGFGRIAAQYASQNLKQHLRRAEKALIFDEFKDRVGDIVRGTVRRFERSDVVIDLGRYEATLPVANACRSRNTSPANNSAALSKP